MRCVDLLVADGSIAKTGNVDNGRRSFVNTYAALRAAIDEWLDHAEAGLGTAGWTAPSDCVSNQTMIPITWDK